MTALSEIYNSRIIELAAAIPRAERLAAPDAIGDGAFQVVRLHDHGRSEGRWRPGRSSSASW